MSLEHDPTPAAPRRSAVFALATLLALTALGCESRPAPTETEADTETATAEAAPAESERPELSPEEEAEIEARLRARRRSVARAQTRELAQSSNAPLLQRQAVRDRRQRRIQTREQRLAIEVLETHRATLEGCFLRDENEPARVRDGSMQITVSHRGQVLDVAPIGDVEPDTALFECLAGLVRDVTFGRSDRETTFTFPLPAPTR